MAWEKTWDGNGTPIWIDWSQGGQISYTDPGNTPASAMSDAWNSLPGNTNAEKISAAMTPGVLPDIAPMPVINWAISQGLVSQQEAFANPQYEGMLTASLQRRASQAEYGGIYEPIYSGGLAAPADPVGMYLNKNEVNPLYLVAAAMGGAALAGAGAGGAAGTGAAAGGAEAAAGSAGLGAAPAAGAGAGTATGATGAATGLGATTAGAGLLNYGNAYAQGGNTATDVPLTGDVTPTSGASSGGLSMTDTAAGLSAAGGAATLANAGGAAGSSDGGMSGGAADTGAGGYQLGSPVSNALGTDASWTQLLGTLGAAGLGAYGANQQAQAYRDIYNDMAARREPYRQQSLAWLNDPNAYISGPGQNALQGVLRGLSVRGNPFDNPTSLGIATDAALRNWQNAVTGLGNLGLAGEDARAGVASNAVNAQGGVYNALGYGLGAATTPRQPTLADYMRSLS